MVQASFNPGFYDVGSLQEAKEVILGPEKHETVEQRWERETPYLAGLMQRTLGLTESSLLLDYGCGIGRMSKEMMTRSGCRAIGVDYSTNMRALAANYVDSARFAAIDAAMLGDVVTAKFDAAITVWVLQHCINPIENILHIVRALKPNGKLFVLNDLRLIPTNVGFVRDDIDVAELLFDHFMMVEKIELSETIGKDLAARSHCAVYER